MEQTISDFRKRQKALRRKHVRMAHGYKTKLGRNGVIIQQPDNKLPGFATRLLVIVGIAFMGFKALMLAGLGQDQYLERLSTLQSGSTFEQLGAWFMQIEPVTLRLADAIALILT